MSISEIWIWSLVDPTGDEGETGGALGDVTGYAVETDDGKIGDVDEASFGPEARGFLVVDTGFWIFGKKRLIPAGIVSGVDHDRRVITLACTKDDVKGAPDLDEVRAHDDAHQQEIGDYFARGRYADMDGDPVGPQAGPGRS
jgi:hypothetical protein